MTNILDHAGQENKADIEHQIAQLYGFGPDYLLMLRRNSVYYLSKFYDMRERKILFSANLAAFIFGPFWLLYRKMYTLGLILLLFYTVPLYINGLFYYISTTVIAILLALFGNSFYLQKIERILRSKQNESPAWKQGYLQIIGGTSVIPIIMALALCALSAFVLGSKGIVPVVQLVWLADLRR